MPPELLNILIQIPIVAVFIWYSDRKDKQFQEFLREQRREYLTVLERLAIKMDEHDAKLDHAVTTMFERTRPTRDRQ